MLNADDPLVAAMSARTAARPLTYGFNRSADISAQGIESAGAAGMRFTVRTPLGRRVVATPVLGRHGVHNCLAATAVGVASGCDLDQIVAGLAEGWTVAHRDQLVRAGEVAILDDSYNASPASVRAALGLLADLPAARKVAVLGEMLELGEAADEGHRAVGTLAAGVADLLVAVGPGAAGLADAALAAGTLLDRVLRATDADEALELLRPRLRRGDLVLVKGSRGIGLDRLVDRLRAESESSVAPGRTPAPRAVRAAGVEREPHP